VVACFFVVCEASDLVDWSVAEVCDDRMDKQVDGELSVQFCSISGEDGWVAWSLCCLDDLDFLGGCGDDVCMSADAAGR